jgi:hypothetical protein
MMLTVCDPQDDEKVTEPLCFLTVMVKVAELLPVTLLEAGENLNLASVARGCSDCVGAAEIVQLDADGSCAITDDV